MGRARVLRWGVFVVLILGGGVGVTILTRSLSWPEQAVVSRSPSDSGLRVEGVIAQLFLREAGLSTRQDPLVLVAADVNAFLAGHVEVRDSPVWPVQVQIHPTEVELGGATTVGQLVETSIGASLAQVLPASVAAHPVWISARGLIAIVSPGRAEFVAHAAAIGRQEVPLTLFWKVVGGRPRSLEWRMPRVVERMEIEPGRIVIHTRRPGPGRGTPG